MIRLGDWEAGEATYQDPERGRGGGGGAAGCGRYVAREVTSALDKMWSL